jgi:non-specific serine/threonine protein kinase
MMTFKGTTKKVKEIANEVNVKYVLEGSVRKVGNNLRITAQLIDVQNDGHLWAEKYSGTVDDIFDIQEKVSKSIVESLDIQLTRKEESDLAHKRTHDSRTLEILMRARYEISKLSEKGFLAAIFLVEKGLEMVGEDAQLFATLSLANLFLHHYGFRTSPTQVEKAKKQVILSLSLDPQCLSAHLVLGILEFYVESNKQGAATIFKKILERERNNPDALRWLALSYLVLGKEEEARPISIRLLQLDPATPETNGIRGWVEMHAGLFQEATPYYEKWLQLDPDQPFTQYYTSLFYAINNEPDKSIQLLDSLVLMFPDSIYEKFALFFKSALKGDKENTLRYATEELRTNGVFLDWLSLGITLGYAFIFEKNETVKWCTIMLNHGLWTYTLYRKIDAFHFLHDHSGFQAFMDEVKRRSEGFEI